MNIIGRDDNENSCVAHHLLTDGKFFAPVYEHVRLKTSRNIRDIALGLFPAAFENTPDGRFFGRFLEYLIRGAFLDEVTGWIITPSPTIAVIDQKPYNKNYVAKRRLEEFEAATGIVLSIGEWRYTKAQARTIMPTWPLDFTLALNEDLAASGTKREKVYFDTGEIFGRARRRKEHEDLITLILKANADTPPAREQEELLKQLDGQNGKSIHRLIYKNWEATLAMAHDLPQTTDKENNTKSRTLRMLDEIQDDVSLKYRTSPKTSRFYAYGPNFTQLPRKIRKVLLSGGVSLDLVAAQAALIARYWGCPKLTKILSTGKPIWRELLRRAGLSIEAKGVIKEALYSAAFGMTPSNIQDNLQNSLITIGYADQEALKIAKRIRSSEIMREILAARKQRTETIDQQNGCRDAFGRWLSVDPPTANNDNRKERSTQLRSALAVEMQSYEQRIMVAMTPILISERVTVLCWLHDGLVVTTRDRKDQDRIIGRIRDAVTSEAKSMGVQTRMEVEAEEYVLQDWNCEIAPTSLYSSAYPSNN